MALERLAGRSLARSRLAAIQAGGRLAGPHNVVGAVVVGDAAAAANLGDVRRNAPRVALGASQVLQQFELGIRVPTFFCSLC